MFLKTTVFKNCTILLILNFNLKFVLNKNYLTYLCVNIIFYKQISNFLHLIYLKQVINGKTQR